MPDPKAPTPQQIEAACQVLESFARYGVRPEEPANRAAPPPSEGGRIPGREGGE